MNASFDLTPAPVKRTARKPRKAPSYADAGDPKGTGIASIYFGPDRLAEVKARASAAGMQLSPYVCAAVDQAAGMDADTYAKLSALARLRGTDVPALVLDLIRDGIGRAAGR